MTVKELIQELESKGYDDEEVLIDGEDIEEVFAEHDDMFISILIERLTDVRNLRKRTDTISASIMTHGRI